MTQAETDLSAVSEEFIQVNVKRSESGEEPNYIIEAIDENSNPTLYVANALNLNGFGFSTSSCQIGEYNERVRLEREAGSSYVNIVVESAE